MQDKDERTINFEISEEKKAAESYKTRFLAIFNNSPQIITINHVSNGAFKEVNDNFLRVLGYTREEVIGKNSVELKIYTDNSEHGKLIEKCETDGSISGLRLEFKTKSGEVRWGLFDFSFIELDGEKCYLVFCTDITDHKKTEKKAYDSEDKFRKAFGSSIVPMSITKISDGTFCEVNDILCKTLDYSKEEMIGKSSLDLKVWASGTDRSEIIDCIKKFGKFTNMLVKFRTKKGEIKEIISSFDIIEYNGEKCLLGIYHDLTETIKLQSLFKNAENRLKTIIENSPLLIFMTGVDGRILLTNRIFETSIKCKQSNITGRHLREIFPPELAERYLADNRKVIESRAVTTVEEKLRIDGEERSFYTTTFPVFDEHGEVIAVGGITIDISDRIKMEEELRSARDAAQVASTAKSMFLTNMSHELRTPMNGIVGFTHLLTDSELSEEQREYVEMIRSSSEHLLGIISDILDFSNIEAGKMKLDSCRFQIRNSLSEAAGIFAELPAKKGIDFKFVTDGLPENLAVMGDQTRLKQIAVNLLSNAFKFTEKGEIIFAAREIGRNEKSVRISLEISDTGPGISEDKIFEIFESFHQLDGSLTRQHGGTGLGLAIVKRLVEMMGGIIEVKSVQGKGSKFTVELPFDLSEIAKPYSKNYRHDTSKPVSCQTLRLLVIEDDLISRELVKRALRNPKYRVTLAEGGEQAVRAFAESEFDAILMDIQMPDLIGLETARRIREEEKRLGRRMTPVIAMTAFASEKDRSHLLASGMNEHLSKPVDEKILMGILEKFIPNKTRADLLPEKIRIK